MNKRRWQPRTMIWGAAVLIAGVALYVGVGYFQSEQAPQGPVAVVVQGERIAQAAVDSAYETLLARYRNEYRQQGMNFDEEFQGAWGAYTRLQIKYDAASILIRDALIRQEARRAGISLSQSEVDQAFQERYQHFLQDNGIENDETLRKLLEDPEKRELTQSLLGLRENTIEEFREHVRQGAEQELLATRLKSAVVGAVRPTDLDLISYVEEHADEYRGKLIQEDQESRFQQWLTDARAQKTLPVDAPLRSQIQQAFIAEATQARFEKWLAGILARTPIQFSDPLLAAHHWERQMETAQNLQEKETYLNRAIAGYEEIQQKKLSSDANVEYYLNRLYNQKVKLTQEQKSQLADSPNRQEEIKRLEGRIADYRGKLSEFFISSGLDDVRAYQAAINSDPENPLFYYLYARALADQENWFQAFKMLSKAIDLDSRYVEAYVLLGDLQMNREHYFEASQEYRKAHEIIRENANREADRIRVQKKLAEADLKLAEQFKSLPERESDRRAALLEAPELLDELLQLVNETDPIYSEILADSGDLARLQGQFDQAVQWYRRSLERAPTPRVEIQLGQTYLLSQKLDEAEDVFQSFVSAYPKAKDGYVGLGDIYRTRNERAKALEVYRQALALVLESKSNASYFERRDIAIRILELKPDDLETRLALARIYLENHVFAGAIHEYQQVLQVKPKSVDVYIGLGSAYQGQANWEKARLDFQEALKWKPTPEQEIQIYVGLLDIERHTAGVAGKSIKEESQKALYRLAELYLQVKDVDRARGSLSELRERFPSYRSKDVARLWEQVGGESHGD